MTVFRKLRISMMMFNVLTVSVVMLAAFSVIYAVTFNNVEQENLQRLHAVSGMVLTPNRTLPGGIANGGGLVEGGGNAGAELVVLYDNERFSAEYGVSFVLYVRDGHLETVSSQLDFADSAYMEAFEKVGENQSGKITLEGSVWLYEVIDTPQQGVNWPNPPGMMGYTRIVFLDITNSIRILHSLFVTLSIVGVLVLLALFLLSYRFAVRAVRPIEENYLKQKQFIADASHQLRTPLAVISANVDAITASENDTVGSQKEWFGYIRHELNRTSKLVDDLLYLARAENTQAEQNLPFNLSAVCDSVCASIEAVLYEAGMALETDISADIIAIADSEKIANVLQALLDNASKYTPEGGTITLSCKAESGKAIVRVKNKGEIPADDLPKIFDRFYRSEASLSLDEGGSGLGLFIARTIVENSGGTISVESTGGFTTFTIALRLARA